MNAKAGTISMMIDKTVKRGVGRPPKTANQRERVLEEAAKLFATIGYDRCTMADIAKAVGITKPAVYHYFPTKQAIYDAIRASNIDDLHAFVTARVDAAEGARDQVHAFMIAHAEFFETHYWRMLAQLAGHGGVLLQNQSDDLSFLEQRRRYEALIKKVLRRGVKDEAFGNINVGATSRIILSSLNWMIRWYTPDGRKSAVAFAEEFVEIILKGIQR